MKFSKKNKTRTHTISSGIWGMMVIAFLKLSRLILSVATPSYTTSPSVGMSCSRANVKLDFPEPVRPTTPIFSPDLMLNDMFCKTKGPVWEYRAERFVTLSVPEVGQEAGGVASLKKGFS